MIYFKNYRDCGYTCNPRKFEIPALRFPRKVPVNPCKHLQCTFFFTVCFFLLVYLLSRIKYIIPWRKKPHLPRWTILTTFKSITIYTYIFNWKYLYFWPLFFNDYVTLLFLNNSAGKGSYDVIPFYNPKYLAKKSIFTEKYSLFMNAYSKVLGCNTITSNHNI